MSHDVYITTTGTRDLLDIKYHLPFTLAHVRWLMNHGRILVAKVEPWGKSGKRCRMYTTPTFVRQFASGYRSKRKEVVNKVVLDLMDFGLVRAV